MTPTQGEEEEPDEWLGGKCSIADEAPGAAQPYRSPVWPLDPAYKNPAGGALIPAHRSDSAPAMQREQQGGDAMQPPRPQPDRDMSYGSP